LHLLITPSTISGLKHQRQAPLACFLYMLAVVLGLTTSAAYAADRLHAIAMHGDPALTSTYTHFPYVNPDAPKGGPLSLAQRGTFDSLNAFIPKGSTPSGLRALVFESLMARSADEPFTLYGLIAQSIEVPPDRTWIIFHIDPKAAFSDGTAITADDVIFTHDILRRKGHNYMRGHYKKVSKVEKLSGRSVRFVFSAAGDRELPLIIGLMPILPKHAIDPARFGQTSMKPPIGSGPYVVANVDPGHSIHYRRNPDYWAVDHPARRGMYNFDEVKLVFYRDDAAVFEAFKTGAASMRRETNPARWIDGYKFPAILQGQAKKIVLKTGRPAGMTGLLFNTRRTKFADVRVRRALALALDAPAINQSLFHGRYVRTQSYFARSSLASTGRPADAREKALLAPFPNAVLPEIMAGTWPKKTSPGLKNKRARLRQAIKLLREAGYELRNRKLIQGATGMPLSVNFLISSTAQERIMLSFAASLKRLGVTTSLRKMEPSQYFARIGDFKFDMIQWHYSASLSPGNEQYNRWSSKAADIKNSLNFAGVKNPAIDALIDAMVEAKERGAFESAVRAYDRVLLSGTYMIPLFHVEKQWYAIGSQLRLPPEPPLLGTSYTTWWDANAK
jgi:peptide/nickel transport system substrate-binding protein